ncbi:MAG: PIN domain nuclease [Bryobacterales bacterium]|nr:PIN domain nuclease [Bryobacterales bacterium]
MILVDSSVWIDYFNGVDTRQTDRLDSLLFREPVAIGDLHLAEVLQGFDSDRDFVNARKLLLAVPVIQIGGADIAFAAAGNFRKLRKMGITVRKTIDTLTATRCIESGYVLLHSDRDFEPFSRHLGLRVTLL